MPETRIYSDRREYLIQAVSKRRRKIKLMAVELKGGKCQICGYKKFLGGLDLHHMKGKKEFGIGEKGYTRSWAKILAELDKCVLLCANCHREVEAGLVNV